MSVRLLIIILYDLSTAVLGWLGAYLFRFNLEGIPESYNGFLLISVPSVLVVHGIVIWQFGIFRGFWRFTSLPDIARILLATVGEAGVLTLLFFLYDRLANVPRSVIPLYTILVVTLMSGGRLFYRLLRDSRVLGRKGQRVLIIGAGQGGEMLARDLQQDPEHRFHPVGFLDDDRQKRNRDIRGIPVLGVVADLTAVAEATHAELILIAMPSANSKQMRAVVGHCEASGLLFRTLPGLKELTSGEVTINSLREVSIEDLLGRDAVSLDWSAMRQWVTGKRLLITGGGGSIGAELCVQTAALEPSQLVIFDQSELNLYQIEGRLRAQFPALNILAVLGDVTEKGSVDRVMRLYPPDMVLHAAAYKHVPILEHQVREAVKNNALGTVNVARAAHASQVGKFVLISTDKAVNPANIMGGSKRVGEIFCQNLNHRSQTQFVTVRFGNVLDSSGSVLPLFRRQIAEGGPVTVTHPEITRYFMTIPEACQLIIQAATLGQGGEIFVLDMGEPMKIRYLAEQMIRLSGKTPGEDIEIVYTGLRPGEKMYEELFHLSENLEPTPHEKILLAKFREVDWLELEREVAALEQGCQDFDEAALIRVIARLVPEHRFTGHD
ncbi:MAG: polysaccharide biosynthesis protein [Deltaproteobacteria bacterium]|nr:polysaccharide biosynthesis protein [Deltaproteobacteria bacterium]